MRKRDVLWIGDDMRLTKVKRWDRLNKNRPAAARPQTHKSSVDSLLRWSCVSQVSPAAGPEPGAPHRRQRSEGPLVQGCCYYRLKEG